MFSTWKQRIALGIYIFLLLSIPVGSYLVSQQTQTKSKASEEPNTADKIVNRLDNATPSGSARDKIRDLLLSSSPSASPTTSSSASATPTTAVTFGPTLNFKLALEGRPTNPPKQAGKVFVGITKGLTIGKQTTYLLSFTIDLPDTGEYEGLSLAGLDAGTQYTAYIKPSAQIATSSAFVMSPGITALNFNKTITLTTGDLNQDNVIDQADYTIALAAYGTRSGGINWNPAVDFNLDGVVNNYDLAYIVKNMAKVGVSGPWISSPSAKIKTTPQEIGGPKDEIIPQLSPDGQNGYWIWVPK